MAFFQRNKNSVTITPKIMKMDASTQESYGGVPGETPQQRRARRRSHWIIYINTLIMSIGFSIIMTGAWPYLQMLSPGISKVYLGWVIAVNPLGQMLASPLLGLLINKIGKVRGSFFVSIFVYIIGNVIYAILPVFGTYATIMMLVSRFIIGVASGNIAICRSYVASSTTLKERTTALSIIGASQAIGVIIGPSIQSALAVAFGDDHPPYNSTLVEQELPHPLSLNVYNTTGWVSAALALINLCLFMPCIFKEFNIENNITEKHEANLKYPKPDYIAVFVLLIPFFFVFFINVLIETILVPMTMDMYAWSPIKAVEYSGIGLSIAGAVTLILFSASGKLTNRFTDRKVMLFLGMIPLTIGLLILIPMGNTLPKVSYCSLNSTGSVKNSSHLFENITAVNESGINSRVKRFTNVKSMECYDYGCPVEQDWCHYTPIIELPQLIIGCLLLTFGYPFVFGVASSIYSKILGPKPQGVWMGLLTSVGSFSRMTGPLAVSYLYVDLGIQVTFGIVLGIAVVVLLITSCFYKRFVPMVIEREEQMQPLDTFPVNEENVT